MQSGGKNSLVIRAPKKVFIHRLNNRPLSRDRHSVGNDSVGGDLPSLADSSPLSVSSPGHISLPSFSPGPGTPSTPASYHSSASPKMPVSNSPVELASETQVNSLTSPHMQDRAAGMEARCMPPLSPNSRAYMMKHLTEQDHNSRQGVQYPHDAALMLQAQMFPATEADMLDIIGHSQPLQRSPISISSDSSNGVKDYSHLPDPLAKYSVTLSPFSQALALSNADFLDEGRHRDETGYGLHYERQLSAESSKDKKSSPGKVMCGTVSTGSAGSHKRQSSVSDELHMCQVCGDVAAGFHCGAYVCEACKKFFVRCLKQDAGEKFACSRNQSCSITKETRTQCQYCRFQKCISLGMYKPGTWPGGDLNAEISNIPCKVCGAASSGYHFGAITCEGCKGFFRRTVKERDGVRYSCSRDGNCTITIATRNTCKFCRYQKCLEVGMTPDGSRIGRQPNAIKHKTMLELKQLHSEGGLLPSKEIIIKEEPVWEGDSNDRLSDKSLPERPPKNCSPQAHSESYNKSPQAYDFHSKDMKDTGHIISHAHRVDSRAAYTTSPRSQYHRSHTETSPSSLSQHPLDRIGRQPNAIKDSLQQQQQAYPFYHSHQYHHKALDRNRRQMSLPETTTSQNSSKTDFNTHFSHHLEKGSTDRDLQQHITGKQRSTSTSNTSPSIRQTQHYPELFNGERSYYEARERSNYHEPGERPSYPQSRERPLYENRDRPMYENGDRNAYENRDRLTFESRDQSFYEGSHRAVYREQERPRYPDNGTYAIAQDFFTQNRGPLLDSATQVDMSTSWSPPEQAHQQTPSPNKEQSESGVLTPEHKLEFPEQNECKKSRQFCPAQMADDVMEASVELLPIIRPAKERTAFVTADMTKTEVWNTMMAQFVHSAHATVKFAKKIPGFKKLPMQEQILKVQNAMYQIVLTKLSTKYDVARQKYLYFCFTEEEERLILSSFPQFKVLPGHFRDMGYAISNLNPDETELALLCALCLVMGDVQSSDSSNEGGKATEVCVNLMDALEAYCKRKYREDTKRHEMVLAHLSELARMNTEHAQCVISIKMEMPDLEIPQLYEETFLGV